LEQSLKLLQKEGALSENILAADYTTQPQRKACQISKGKGFAGCQPGGVIKPKLSSGKPVLRLSKYTTNYLPHKTGGSNETQIPVHSLFRPVDPGDGAQCLRPQG
jgi:hypothetical protein